MSSQSYTYPEVQQKLKSMKGRKTSSSFNPRIVEFKAKTRKSGKKGILIQQKPMKRQATTVAGRAQDRKRKAMRPGRRKSRTGRKYTERRSNRSDTKSRHY